MSELIQRRSFLIGFGSLLAAPAVVQASSLMPVSAKLLTPPPIDWASIELEAQQWALLDIQVLIAPRVHESSADLKVYAKSLLKWAQNRKEDWFLPEPFRGLTVGH